MNTPCPNTVPYRGGITRERRERLLKQKSMVLWFTGLSGSGKNYTGISAPYEEPKRPDLVLETDRCSLEECVEQVAEFVASQPNHPWN